MNILNKPSIQRSLDAYMRTVLYDFEEYLAQKPLLLKKLERVRLIFNDGESCYTNESAIVIGTEFPLFKEEGISDDLVYVRTQGVIVHEIAHILYTDFEVFSTFYNTASRKYKKLSGVSKDLFNLMEDLRIESTLAEMNPFFKKIFLMCRFNITKNLKSKLQEQKEKGFSDDKERASFMINSILVMGFIKKPFMTNDSKVNGLIRFAYLTTMKALKAKNTEELAGYCEDIMKLIQKLDIPEESLDDLDISDAISDLSGSSKAKGSKNPVSSDANIGSGSSETSGTSGGETDGEANATGEVSDIGANLEAADEDIDEDFNEVEKNFEEESNDIERQNATGDIVNEYLNKEHDERKEREQKSEEKKIKDFTKELPEIHSGVTLKFRDRMDKFGREDYFDKRQALAYHIRKTVNKIEEVKHTIIEDYEYEKKSGTIDTSSLARFSVFGDIDIFKQQYPEEEVLEMDVMLLVDCSGSNAASVMNDKNGVNIPRYVVNQMMAVYLHEVLKELKFKHSVWGFDSGRSENISPMITFQNCFDKEAGLNLGDIGARSANRDGYHIRLAGKMLDANAESRNKLLIVISDGQPSAGGYSGSAAMKDVIDSQEELGKFDIKTIGIFTGHSAENKYFSDMYENHYFLNNESIENFPDTIHELLTSQFEDHQGW